MTRVEAATVDDVDRIADLWVDLARDQRDHGSHLLSDANRDEVRNTIARRVVTDGLLVAREAGIVGFVMFGIESGTYRQDVTRGVVHNFYVDPRYRDGGVGSDLLAAAESELAAAGADVLSLEVMADNEAARRLYRRHGYAPHRVEFEKAVESDTHSKE